MSNIKKIIKNTMTGWMAKAIQIPIALVMVPFLIRAAGEEGYGLIGLFSVFFALASVADMGLRSALGRELAEKVALKDKQGFQELSATALSLYLVIAGSLVGLIWIMSPWLVSVFKVGEPLRRDAVLLFRIYGCSATFLSFVSPVFSSGLTSFMRFDLDNNIQTSTFLLTNLLIFLFVSLWKDQALYIWVFVTLSGSCAATVMLFFAYKSICYGGVLDLALVKLKHLRSLFSLGGKMYVIQMAQTLSDKADPLIISHFLGPTGVALYQPASKAALSLNPIVMTLTGQLYPLTTAFHTSGNKKSMNRMLFDGTRYTLLLGILFSAGIFIFAEPFARLWLAGSLGDAYKTVAHLMKLFAIIELFSYASGTQWPILLGMKKLTFLTNLHIITAVLNITLSIYFVGFTSIGIYGVLYGTLISKIIRTFFLYGYMSNIMKFHPLTFISQTLARPVLCLILTGFAGFILKENFSCQTWGDFVYLAGFTTLAWVGSCLVFGVSEGERVMLCNAGKGMYCKVRGKI